MTTTTSSPKSRSQELQAEIQAYLNDVAAWLLKAGRSDLTKNLKDAVEARRSTTPTVVVIGETSRGKSSLVNALLNRTELSPIGLDTTTGCNVVLHHADHLQARVRLIETGEIVDIPIDEIEDWATVDGNPDNQRGVFAVILGVDCPLLEQMTIVDTPGVGGLDAGHGALAAEAAAAADAAVLVVDPNAPISGPELRFLANVAEKVDNVAIVLTKVEDYPEWRTMAETDAQLVAGQVPRLAETPVFPVSNILAMNPADRAESGIETVEEHLRSRIAARTEVLRYANILRVAESGLAEVGRVQRAQHAALEAGAGTLAALKAERTRLESVGVDGKKLLRDLDDGLRRLSLDRADGLNRGMRDLRTSYDEHVATLKPDAISALPAQLISDVTALADRLSEEARDRLTALTEDLISPSRCRRSGTGQPRTALLGPTRRIGHPRYAQKASGESGGAVVDPRQLQQRPFHRIAGGQPAAHCPRWGAVHHRRPRSRSGLRLPYAPRARRRRAAKRIQKLDARAASRGRAPAQQRLLQGHDRCQPRVALRAGRTDRNPQGRSQPGHSRV